MIIDATKSSGQSYQQCTRCVMDTTVTDIIFDKQGVCNYCRDFLERSSHIIHEDAITKEARLEQLVRKVLISGRGKPYDCIVGISGGVDSSWVLVEVKRLGMRPLAVHMDNGWNSELAQNNIANLVRSLNVDLYTHVIDWEEYRRLMQAFFDADVIDVELLYDNAMIAVNYQQASKYGLKYILAGTNQATEGMLVPKDWNWFKYDKRNITSIASTNGIKKITTSFPMIGTVDFMFNRLIKRIHWISFLDYLPYNKLGSLNELEKKYGYKRYYYKHYESVFTRFYQGYILPKKFNVDKRRLHLSTLIISDQITREEAINYLDRSTYELKADLEADISYFLKKMRWKPEDLEKYISRHRRSHSYYATERPFWEMILKIGRYILKKT